LRRSDRWLVHSHRVRAALESAADPLVVDLGYGALPVTTLELATRLRAVRPDVTVVGLEIDPARVASAQSAARPGVRFAVGGFELAGLRPVLVRAFNVLRQYPVEEVPAAWATLRAGLAPGGLLVDGTCDPAHIERPSDLAERLPKVLIHHNVPGQPIHSLLTAADRAWAHASGQGVFGPRARWREMVALLVRDGLPAEPQRRRLRDAVLTVPWDAVAPV